MNSYRKFGEDEGTALMKKREEGLFKKIRNQTIGIGLGFLGLITLASSTYTVDQTEQAVVTRMGKAKKVILNPLESEDQDRLNAIKESYEEQGIVYSEGAGIYLKWPLIESVKKFDRRLLRWNGDSSEIPTKDKKYIFADVSARWKIDDPYRFFISLQNESSAYTRLDDKIDSALRAEISSNNLEEAVRSDNRVMEVSEKELANTSPYFVEKGRGKIVDSIEANSRALCSPFGVDVSSILIRDISYVPTVETSVEERMISERKRVAQKYVSEGEGEYSRIIGEVDKKEKEILSGAEKEAQRIRGEADALAIEIYARGFTHVDEETGISRTYNGFESDPEFYTYLRTLDLYRRSFGPSTTIVLGTDNNLLSLLKGENQAN